MITKDILIAKGVSLFAQKGYHSTSIKDIIEEAKIPKGSFYYYFESKELFGIEIINYYADQIGMLMQSVFNDDSTPDVKIKRFFEQLLGDTNGKLFESMRALNKLHYELDDRNEMLAQALTLTYNNFISHIESQLRLLEMDKILKQGTDVMAVAGYIFYSAMGILDQNSVQQKAVFFEVFDFLLE